MDVSHTYVLITSNVRKPLLTGFSMEELGSLRIEFIAQVSRPVMNTKGFLNGKNCPTGPNSEQVLGVQMRCHKSVLKRI